MDRFVLFLTKALFIAFIIMGFMGLWLLISQVLWIIL